jgi:hypothetical protein
MITSLLIASHTLVLQSAPRDPALASQTQDAVLVVPDPSGVGGELRYSVTTPMGSDTGALATLSELRDAVRVTDATLARPAYSTVIDRTIGGRPKSKADGGEGGIAGGGQGFDLVFHVSSSSIIPNSILSQFVGALEDIELYFESQITSPVQVDISLAYVQLAPGRLGTTSCRYAVKEMQSVFNALNDPNAILEPVGDDVQSSPVGTTLPVRYSGISVAVTPENRVYTTQALQKALGIYTGGGIGALTYDGVVTLNNTIQWDFDPSNGLASGATYLYSFQDALIRELLQIMGFVAGADFLVRDCTVMDLFRFQRDIIDPSLAVVDPADLAFPPPTCQEVDDVNLAVLISGGHFPGHGLDYNPGLNKATIASAAALAPPVTADQLIVAAGGPAGYSSIYLVQQMRGLLDVDGNPMTALAGNVFDDARLPIDDAAEITAYPDGATQEVVSLHGGAHCAFVDFRENDYTIGGVVQPVQFLGVCPRLVARNSPSDGSILNFLQDTARLPGDFEISMYDGSPVRGCFVIQDELAELSTRCLMGKSIGKGITWWSRDPAIVPAYSAPLGNLPDFLTRREWLILDSMGWAATATGAAPSIDATAE